MRLAKGALFLSLVAPEIILDCVRQLSDGNGGLFSLEQFCYALGAPTDEAQPVLEAMINAGYVLDTCNGPKQYEPTKEFARLKLATLGDGLSRGEASMLLKKVLARAVEINAKPDKYGGIRVRTLAVFGSYLSDTAILSDLDLGFDTEITSKEHHDQAIKEVVAHGRLFSRKGPVDKVPGLLRCRSKHVSLHTMSELERLRTPFVILLANGKPTEGLT